MVADPRILPFRPMLFSSFAETILILRKLLGRPEPSCVASRLGVCSDSRRLLAHGCRGHRRPRRGLSRRGSPPFHLLHCRAREPSPMLSMAATLRARRTIATVAVVTDVASRELRNNTRELLDRVEAGETITITVEGRPVAVLQPDQSPAALAIPRRVRPARRRPPGRRRPRRASCGSLGAGHDRRSPPAVTRGLADTSVFIARESGRALRSRPAPRRAGRLGHHDR